MPNPPKPIERKRRAGNPGKRPLPEPIAIVPRADRAPHPPKGLRAPGRSVWAAVWAAGADWLAPSDHLAVADP